MDIIDSVNSQRDLKETLNRSLSVLVQLYTSAPHFIFELLQNAEDSRATSVLFRQFSDRLEFYHNGRPFTERNLRGLTDVGLSDKLPENNQIGKFGVGFKSVFTICREVIVASDPSHWDRPGNYPKFTAKIVDFVNLEKTHEVVVPDEYTTAFIFPYATDRKFNGYRNLMELRETVAAKLQQIGSLSLLFLSYVKTIKYDINLPSIKKSGDFYLEVKTIKDASFSLVKTAGEEGDIKEGEVKNSSSEYLLFSRPCTSDKKRNVSIAFEVGSVRDEKTKKTILKFKKSEKSCISSYFPTGTISGVNFIVQGPFITTPNRSEILDDNTENKLLVCDVAVLLQDAIRELCKFKLVNAEFINLLPFDKTVFKNLANPLLAPLVETITKMFTMEKVLPTEDGDYISGIGACISRNNEMVRLIDNKTLSKLMDDGSHHAWLSTQIKQYCEYDSLFNFLSKQVKVPVFTPDTFREYFNRNPDVLKEKDNNWLTSLYNVYSTLPNSFNERSAATNMLTARILKTASGEFVPAYRDDGTGKYIFNVFRPLSRKSGKDAENMIDPDLYKANRKFFDEILRLPVLGGFDVFVSEFVDRYSSDEQISDKQHISDVKQLIEYVTSPATKEKARELIENHLKLFGKIGERTVFRNPRQGDYKFSISDSGDSLVDYYKGVTPLPCFVDEEFYDRNGVPLEELFKLRVQNEIVSGVDTISGTDRKLGTWTIWGKFRYDLMIDRLPDALVAIQDFPQDSSSKLKSKLIFNVLREYKDALKGKLRINDSKTSEELTCKALAIVRNESRIQMSFMKEWRGAWLYTKDGVLSVPGEITKDDLDEELYGDPISDDSFYELLGLKYNEKQAVAVKIREMPQSMKDEVFKQELQRRASDPAMRQDIIKMCRSNGVLPKEFDASDEAFPATSVHDIERLRQHVIEQLAFADPVRFEYRKRSIRVSSIASRAKQYLDSNYKLHSGARACQMCHKFVKQTEAVEIFVENDLELEPMHLCVCRNCSPDYRKFRFDEDKVEKLRSKILSEDDSVFYSMKPVEICVGKMHLWFTPLHFAEIRMLLEVMGL